MSAIALKAWAESKGLHLQTAQRYVKEGRIVPAPVKVGRAWTVAADAVVVVQPIHRPHRLKAD